MNVDYLPIDSVKGNSGLLQVGCYFCSFGHAWPIHTSKYKLLWLDILFSVIRGFAMVTKAVPT